MGVVIVVVVGVDDVMDLVLGSFMVMLPVVFVLVGTFGLLLLLFVL